MNVVISVVVVVVALGAVAFGLLVFGMRFKSKAVLNAVRRMNRRVKPRALKSAGTADSPNAVVHHVGRRSGRDYATPIVAAHTDDGFVVALPYGTRSDWLHNVLAAGSATLAIGGRTVGVTGPQVVPIASVNHWFAKKEQRMHRVFGVREALVLRSSAPGS